MSSAFQIMAFYAFHSCFVLFSVVLPLQTFAQEKFQTPYEISGGKSTATYKEGILYFRELASYYPTVTIKEIGPTDSGFPLSIVTYNADINKDKKIRILVMNAIHPGEPDGVDASMMLLRDIASQKKLFSISDSFILYIIPFYNIGGALNRSPYSRVNQNGPDEYGFRGNARNYDLNRDFMKMDTKNAWSFAEIYHEIDPDVFVDTHTSNGADYQYTVTCLETHPTKMGGSLGPFLSEEFSPALFKSMKNKHNEMCPFVNVYNQTPDKGFNKFNDHPHYSTGYTTLFNTLGFMSESHMLKPFNERVEATYLFLSTLIEESVNYKEKIKKLRNADKLYWQETNTYTIQWETDKTKNSKIQFKGYEANEIPSKVTGLSRLYYDRSKPYSKEIAYFNELKSSALIVVPKAYIIPKAWNHILNYFSANQISIDTIQTDSLIAVESYKIKEYQTYSSPYEGHYLHYNTSLNSENISIEVKKGDFMVYTHQAGIRYILETLEPGANDSFFNWNFFDSILMQKEGYSSYVFEEVARSLLEKNKWLDDSLQRKKNRDTEFAKSSRAQLNYIYENSPYFELAYQQYPIYRILK